MIAGSFPKIPCVKRTKISKMIQQQSSSPARAPADSWSAHLLGESPGHRESSTSVAGDGPIEAPKTSEPKFWALPKSSNKFWAHHACGCMRLCLTTKGWMDLSYDFLHDGHNLGYPPFAETPICGCWTPTPNTKPCNITHQSTRTLWVFCGSTCTM